MTEDRKKRLMRLIKDNNSILILVVFILVGDFFITGFTNSFYKAILQSAEYGAACLGLGIVMVTGNIDLSVGFMATLCSCNFVTLFNATYGATGSVPLSLVIGLLAALCTGALCGLLNGFIITKVGISPLIATIATNYIFKGFVRSVANSSYYTESTDTLKAISTNAKIFGLRWLTPMTLIFVLLVALIFFWMYKTRFGSRLHVVGDNPEAAAFAGISVPRTVLVTYIICGLLAAVTGFLMVCYDGYAIYSNGETLNTLPISCCVIGGIKMAGGKGTAVHILIGVLIMRVIEIMMRCLYLTPDMVNLIQGILLIVVLLIDRFTSTKQADE